MFDATEIREASVPDRLNVIESPSASVAVSVPMLDCCSSTVNEDADVKTGAISFTFVTFTVIY